MEANERSALLTSDRPTPTAISEQAEIHFHSIFWFKPITKQATPTAGNPLTTTAITNCSIALRLSSQTTLTTTTITIQIQTWRPSSFLIPTQTDDCSSPSFITNYSFKSLKLDDCSSSPSIISQSQTEAPVDPLPLPLHSTATTVADPTAPSTAPIDRHV
jgi:hypothetical protein